MVRRHSLINFYTFILKIYLEYLKLRCSNKNELPKDSCNALYYIILLK
jgi:hypothetical protein